MTMMMTGVMQYVNSVFGLTTSMQNGHFVPWNVRLTMQPIDVLCDNVLQQWRLSRCGGSSGGGSGSGDDIAVALAESARFVVVVVVIVIII